MDPSKVNSPTYTYIQEYVFDSKVQKSSEFRDQSSEDQDGGESHDEERKKLLHIDMYNIHSFDQLVEKGIAELVHDYQYIAIEWPKFMDELGLDGTMITIHKKDGDEREIVINGEL
jgi:tRNA A37 threonylcarbamoyladenosine biosynthesis protein TsaE